MLMRISLVCATTLSLVGLLWAPGCLPQPSAPEATGSLRVLITDKPFPFDLITSAIVTLNRVEVRMADPNDPEDANLPDDPNQANPFIVVFDDPNGRDFDLVDLRNGRTDLLADANVPVGTYTLMRLIVTGGEVTLTDGRTFPLTVPSGEQTGIKLHFTFDVLADQQTVLLLDVDLSRAFTPIPGGHIDDVSTIRTFHFSPSIAMRLIRLLDAGSIQGTVTDSDDNPLGGASVTVFDDQEEVATTATEDDGTYVLGGLPTGSYRLEFSATGFATAEIPDVAVTAGETTNIDVALDPN